MTKEQIEAILERVRAWPPERQEDAAHILLQMEEQDQSVYRLSEEDIKAVEESRAQMRRGEYATDEEVAALFARYRE